MRYLTRNKVYEKLPPKKEAKRIYILCEGAKTENRYFEYFDGFSSNISIIPIPNNNGKSDPIKLKEASERLFLKPKPDYPFDSELGDEIWFLIDTDRWNEHNKIETLDNIDRLAKYIRQIAWRDPEIGLRISSCPE